jgi:hypothetical protein
LLIHDFRRSAVRDLTRSGAPDYVAMRITGHKRARSSTATASSAVMFVDQTRASEDKRPTVCSTTLSVDCRNIGVACPIAQLSSIPLLFDERMESSAGTNTGIEDLDTLEDSTGRRRFFPCVAPGRIPVPKRESVSSAPATKACVKFQTMLDASQLKTERGSLS